MRRYSWLLAVLGGVAVLSFLSVAVFTSTGPDTTWSTVGGVGVALVALWMWLDRDALARASATRGARYTVTSLTLVVLAAGIAVAVNVLAHRYDKRWDLTASRQYSLSEQSVQVVRNLDRDVKVLAFFSRGSQEEANFKDRIESYTELSDHLSVEWIDPLLDPRKAREHDITSAAGTVILVSGDDEQRLETDFGEEALTNALIRLTSGEEHTVCFTSGHGELDPDDDATVAGLGGIVTKMEGQNYKAEKVLLAREGGVPERCEMLVAADPEKDWLPAEREMLAAYVAGGGKFLLLLEPTHAPGLAADMARYGITVGDDVVLEQNPNYALAGGDPSYIILDPQSFDHHEITDAIKGAVLLRLVRSVSKGDDVKGIRVQELAHTTEQGWAETSLGTDAVAQPDPGQDIIGNVPLMAVAEVDDPETIAVGDRTIGERAGALDAILGTPAEAAPAEAPPVERKKGGRVLVIGDVDFATNMLIDQFANQDLFLNSVAWMVGEENQVSIRPNEAARGTLTMNLFQGIILWLTALLFVPGLAVVGALVTWLRRRNR